MSNTDTNQASEDELSLEIDDYIDDIRYNNEVPFDERLEAAKKSIKHLIRTEKLKLLDRLHHEYYEVDEDSLDTLIEVERNKLKESSNA